MKFNTVLIVASIFSNISFANTSIEEMISSRTVVLQTGSVLFVEPKVIVEGRAYLITSDSDLSQSCLMLGKTRLLKKYYAATEPYYDGNGPEAKPSISCEFENADPNCEERIMARIDNMGSVSLVDARSAAVKPGVNSKGIKNYIKGLNCR